MAKGWNIKWSKTDQCYYAWKRTHTGPRYSYTTKYKLIRIQK